MDSEEWTTIKGYEYFISTHGVVENAITGQILKPTISTKGYYYVSLCKNGKVKKYMIHRLVAEAFIDNKYNKRCIDHIDNNRLNNHIDNLRWATNQENGRNSSIRSDNTSGIKGVSYHISRKKWRARVFINGKEKHIGLFKTIEEAQNARQEYANEFFGEYTNNCEKL